jgi:hypothetical protein
MVLLVCFATTSATPVPATVAAPDPIFKRVDCAVSNPKPAIIVGPELWQSFSSGVHDVTGIQRTESSNATIRQTSGDQKKEHDVKPNVKERFLKLRRIESPDFSASHVTPNSFQSNGLLLYSKPLSISRRSSQEKEQNYPNEES